MASTALGAREIGARSSWLALSDWIGEVTRLITAFPDAAQVWVMALQGATGEQIGRQIDQLSAAGYDVEMEQGIEFTGAL